MIPHHEESDDQSLMERFQKGDETAFQPIFDRYAGHLVNFSFRFLRSREEAEDIAQEVLVRVYLKKDRYDPARPFRPWLFAIASHLLSNRIRDRRKKSTVSFDFAPDENEDGGTLDLADPAQKDPHERLETDQAMERIAEALASLPVPQRMAVLLARFEEMSYEEIALTLKTSTSAVKSLLFRAKQTLARVLAS